MANISAVSEPKSNKKHTHKQMHLQAEERPLPLVRLARRDQIRSKKHSGIFIIKAMASPKVMGAVMSISREIKALIGEKLIISKSITATVASANSLRENLLSPIFHSKIHIIIYRSVDEGEVIYSAYNFVAY